MNTTHDAEQIAHRIKHRPNFAASLIVGIIGLAVTAFIFWPVGLALIIVAALNDKTTWLCSQCRNKIEPTSHLCPACHADLAPEPRKG